MRQLTFQGFIKKYVSELSYSGTAGYYKLLKELPNNPRLEGPLFLYAATTLAPEDFQKFVNRAWHSENLSNIGALWKLYAEENTNIDEYCKLPEEYKKVFATYRYYSEKYINECEKKQLMCDKILKLQEETNISTYRIQKALNLNSGNLNCFLKKKNMQKMSLATTRQVLKYLKERSSVHNVP